MKLLGNLVLSLGILFSLSACGQESDTVELNITGADYAGTGIRAFRVKNPDVPDAYGDGGSMAPYGGGGIRCCYQVPKQWHEGLTAEIEVYYPLKGKNGDEMVEDLKKREAAGNVTETFNVSVPKYQTPAAGTLWVQFMPDKEIKVVVSDLSPDHEDFPGDVKGWPVPSDEYRISLIDRDLKLEKGDLKLFIDSLDEWTNEPSGESLRAAWVSYEKHFKDKIKSINGYKDPRFLELLIKESKADIAAKELKIKRLKEYKESISER
ncbi:MULTISPECIES: DUF3304 domain-containing protein [unclassified Cobetia]|uniref:DUF3304 domain-containing protein n=1 Tax=unclassified Cobetia TaxID=2609414 RepID=UPI00178CC059|nr:MULTISPECIES: DUF3304 domain-containing protein [unclassified Cobetia]MBE2167842.1 DUF3304 domain-containing protein [Cobetia sp. 2AS1]MDH2446265.1 DUF3304 domain-containing protein [Cobetia sp. 2AS]